MSWFKMPDESDKLYNEMTTTRRLAIALISPEFIGRILKQGTSKVEIASNSLPQDAEIVGVGHYSAEYGAIALVVKSAWFRETPEGVPLPILPRTTFRELNAPTPYGIPISVDDSLPAGEWRFVDDSGNVLARGTI